MSYAFVKNALRRHLRIYAYARRVMLLGQYVTRISGEQEFGSFRSRNDRGEGLIVDNGANGGQSAVAFAFLLPKDPDALVRA